MVKHVTISYSAQQYAVLCLAEHFGVINEQQRQHALESMSENDAAWEFLVQAGYVDASDRTLLIRRLSDLTESLEQHGRTEHLEQADRLASAKAAMSDVEFIDEAEEPEEDWQPWTEQFLDRYLPVLRRLSGYHIPILLGLLVLITACLILWWPATVSYNGTIPAR